MGDALPRRSRFPFPTKLLHFLFGHDPASRLFSAPRVWNQVGPRIDAVNHSLPRTGGPKMHRNIALGTVLLAAASFAAPRARADATFTATLSVANEVPANSSTATGSAT